MMILIMLVVIMLTPNNINKPLRKKRPYNEKKKKRNFFFFIYFQTHTCASAQKARYSACLLMRARVFFFSFFSFSPPFPAEIHRDQQFCLFTYLWFKTASFYLRAFLPTKCHFLCIGACIKNIAWMTVI